MKSSVRIVFAVLLGIVTTAAEATGQISDKILIDGRTELLFTEPLEGAFRANPGLWLNLMSRITMGNCSASWRGYAATWEVRKKELYLVSVKVNPCSSRKLVPLAELFAGATGPVKATWFTGTLVIPQGKLTEYVHMGYESRYERYLYLQMDKGKVTNSTIAPGIQKPVGPPGPPGSGG